jgi:TolB protein
VSKSRDWAGLAALAAFFWTLPGGAANVEVSDGRIVRVERGEIRVINLPAKAVTQFGTAGDRILVGAEPRATAAGTDGWGGMNLWSIGLDGSGARRLTQGQKVLRAVWSDAARLAAVWTRDMEVELLDLEGRVVRRLARAASPAFSPDGSRLAYAALPASWRPGSLPGGFDLHVIDLATGIDRKLTSGYDDAEPIWTPDGRDLLFLSGGRTGLTSFWRISAEGGEPRQITNMGKLHAGEGFVPNPSANLHASWSEDGSRLLYGAHYTEAGEIIVLDLDRAGNVIEARDLGPGHSPAWAGRGTVQVIRKGAAGLEVDELSVEGEGVRRVIEIAPAPSPSRSEWRPDRDSLLDLSGIVEKTHTNPPRYRYPLSYHPSGNRYYYDNDSRSGYWRSWKCNAETYDGHRGSDYPAPCGTAIYAGHGGPVSVRNDGCANVGYWGNTCGGGFGNYVRLNNGNSWYSIYAHMQAGTPVGYVTVSCGQYIGTSYSSGNSTGCHLHFEVQHYGYPYDDPYAGSCSGPESFWCNQNGDGSGFPGRVCC